MALLINIRLFLPIFVALLLLIISSVPIYISGASAFFPAVDIMVIYYWAGYKPDSMPNWFVFLLGIFRDVLEGVVIGVSPCIYLIIKLMVVAGRGLYRRESFPVVWQGLAVITVIAITGKWMLISFIMNAPIALNPAIMQVLFSIAVYPVVHWFFNLIYITMPETYQDV